MPAGSLPARPPPVPPPGGRRSRRSSRAATSWSRPARGRARRSAALFPCSTACSASARPAPSASRACARCSLYPLNALANDQMRRLRAILASFADVSFGRYVGDTERDARRALETYQVAIQGRDPLPNEILSRHEMQARPPHILITNYSMLEYLLLRPSDSPFFDGPTRRFWRAFVLDEAHVYDGADGTEVAMLLRRLKDRVADSEPGRIRCIATSATLGGGEQDYPALAEFGGSLFGEPFEATDIIGPRVRQLAAGGGRVRAPAPALPRRRHRDRDRHAEGAGGPRPPARCGGAAPGRRRARRGRDPARRRPARPARARRARHLPPEPARATARSCCPRRPRPPSATRPPPTTSWRSWNCAVQARENDMDSPLVPARYHFFLRGLEGAYVCLHPEHPAARARLFLEPHDACPACDDAGVRRRRVRAGRVPPVPGRVPDRGDPRRHARAGADRRRARRRTSCSTPPRARPTRTRTRGTTSRATSRSSLCPGCGRVDGEPATDCDCASPAGADPDAARARSPRSRRAPAGAARAARPATAATSVGRFLTDQNAPAAVIATDVYRELPTCAGPGDRDQGRLAGASCSRSPTPGRTPRSSRRTSSAPTTAAMRRAMILTRRSRGRRATAPSGSRTSSRTCSRRPSATSSSTRRAAPSASCARSEPG